MKITEEIKSIFQKMLDKNGIIRKKLYNLYRTEETDKLLHFCFDSYSNFSFYIKNNLTEIPKCLVCGSEIKKFGTGQIFCSCNCSNKSKETKEKIKQTNLERYGVENPSQAKEIQDKRKQNNLSKYGVENVSQIKEIQDKIKNTFLERYGYKNPLQSKEIQDKLKNTNLKKYGVEYTFQSKDIIEKIKQTNLERYGVENVSQIKEIQDKIKNTFLERYGYKNPLQSKEIQDKLKNTNLKKYNTEYYVNTEDFKEKAKQTFLERYGVENPSQAKEIQDKRKQNNLSKYGVENVSQIKEIQDKIKNTKKINRYDTFINTLIRANIQLLDTKEEFINNINHKFKCLNCNTVFISDKTNIQLLRCPECSKLYYVSNKELELRNFIQSLLPNIEIIANNRKTIYPLELDIYIPEKNLAIEFNGDYWHSSERKDKNYHLEKTLKCQEKEIRLIHIFEHEWDFKRPIVESILRNALGSIENRIYARKCFVLEISQKEYSNFLELNHIQGSIISKYRYGLFYNSELVSVIGFGSSRFKKGEIELHRFCSKINTSIIGGFSKLIKYFMNQNICSEFITYVDRSKFDAKGYFKIGFKILSETDSSYFYAKNGEILSRYQCQKHKLVNLLENYDPSLSETDNMILNGYLKVYDCGTLKLIYKR